MGQSKKNKAIQFREMSWVQLKEKYRKNGDRGPRFVTRRINDHFFEDDGERSNMKPCKRLYWHKYELMPEKEASIHNCNMIFARDFGGRFEVMYLPMEKDPVVPPMQMKPLIRER